MNVKIQGFLQALVVFIYCIIVGLFMFNANHLFGPTDTFLAPVFALMLFSASALICGLIVFYKPYKLFFDGKKKEAANVVIFTSLWLFLFLFIAFFLMVAFK